MRNALGREIPSDIVGNTSLRPYGEATCDGPERSASRCVVSGAAKLLPDLKTALREAGARNGSTLSFHHHLRNGDHVLNMVLDAAAELGLTDLRIAPSSIFPVHAKLVEHIQRGVVSSIYTAYVVGPVAAAIGAGDLRDVAVLQTHGGRARAIESGELAIDIAFIAAPTADDYGNVNGIDGPSACGSLGYALVDARHARRVVAVTDHLVPYPARRADITQDLVDMVVVVESIGDAAQIVSGTTRITDDPIGLEIAATTAKVIEAANLLVDGFSFQTGAGGISLAVAKFVGERMRSAGICGSFAAGGVTAMTVQMLEAGLFSCIFDVQCFDLEAIRSYRENADHQCMSASLYANPWNAGAIVNRLDAMILGATEVDLDFNVNVTTRSNGSITGGSGGHSDTAAGAKAAIVTTRLRAGLVPKIVERVTTATTPGTTVDVVVTEAGLAVNPGRPDLKDRLIAAGIPVVSIERLRDFAAAGSGSCCETRLIDDGRVVALQQYRDGTVIDVIRQTRRQ
ncbi:Citrate lyase alpha chain [Paraburkholderia sediminicola]|uniref:Citrate lyase alpha chain n=1 Tax=Paraburkholderia sediminicola TaxID=458836 RepID=A0A6J5CVT3_9BURK|nr:citrate lyase subunit alpha [Paraburkholderia sediminicola]CAB3743798.1 Citrate lyase alpha chain [Paraburkholderia sediminicola]